MNDIKETLTLEGIGKMGYGMINKMPMKDKRLSIEAKAIYAYMCSYSGGGTNEAFPSVELMCYDLNISERRLRKYRDELVKLGYIEIVKMKVEGKNYKKNKYIIKMEIEKSVSLQSVPLQIDRVSNSNGTESVGCQNDSNNNNNSFNNNSNINNNNKDIKVSEKPSPAKLIFDHYNSKGIIKHARLTNIMEKEIKNRLKEYDFIQLIQAIDNYNIVYRGDQYYFDTKYTLAELMREKDVPKFIDESEPLTKMLKFNRKQGVFNKDEKVLTAEEQALKDLLDF